MHSCCALPLCFINLLPARLPTSPLLTSPHLVGKRGCPMHSNKQSINHDAGVVLLCVRALVQTDRSHMPNLLSNRSLVGGSPLSSTRTSFRGQGSWCDLSMWLTADLLHLSMESFCVGWLRAASCLNLLPVHAAQALSGKSIQPVNRPPHCIVLLTSMMCALGVSAYQVNVETRICKMRVTIPPRCGRIHNT